MPTALEQAQERLSVYGSAWAEAAQNLVNASAEVARLTLIARAEEEGSEVAGLTFGTEYCYDDEGGYFETISVALIGAEGEYLDCSDELESFGPEAIRRLCGYPEGADEGAITVAEARERSF